MFFFFFLIIDLYFLIRTGITQIFIVAGEFVIPKGKPTKEAKVEIETEAVTAEAKVSKWSI